jgi:prepilin-type processing-associated H-X9-DG protein
VVLPYVKNVSLFTCPLTPTRKWSGVYSPGSPDQTMGYGYNFSTSGAGTGHEGMGRAFTKTGMIKAPSQFIALGDSQPHPVVTTLSDYLQWDYPLSYAHSSGMNAAFADGHAEWRRTDSLSYWLNHLESSRYWLACSETGH